MTINTINLENYQNKLFPYAYNILGSSEDAKDAVQDVLEKYFSAQKTGIENPTGYLTKAVINQSINIKRRKKKISSESIWLPEPVSTEDSDGNLHREEIISYSMLVLLEQLNPKERAVFILKEAFDYSHKEIADTLKCTIENARKLLSRAKRKLIISKKENSVFSTPEVPPSYMENYIHAIKNGDTQALKKMLSDDISLAADGGDEIKVVRELTVGKSATSNLLFYVYREFQQLWSITLSQVNHQPALLFYQDNQLVNCQVFDIKDHEITHIYAVIDPHKLRALS